MKDIDKAKALLELGSKTLDATAKAHKDLEGLALGAALCSIRASYEMQARAIINYTRPPESDSSIIVGTEISRDGIKAKDIHTLPPKAVSKILDKFEVVTTSDNRAVFKARPKEK